MEPTGILFADRSERAKLRFTGPQAAWFLHQVTTQAFEDMPAGEARAAAMITAHGRMVGYMETVRVGEDIYCHFESELRTGLPEALSRYVLATRVEIHDETERWGMVLLVGAGWELHARGAAGGAFVHPTDSLGVPAGYVWLPRPEVPQYVESLTGAGATPATEAVLESIRIAHGIPRWGHEMDAKTIPLEVGLERWAIHFDKGCYVGQEAIAKIHLRGRPNKRIARVKLGAEVAVPAELSDGEAAVGRVTSAAGTHGIAVVRHTVAAGTRLQVDSTFASVLD